MQKNSKRFLTKYRKEELSELAEYIAEYYCPDNMISPELIAKKNGISFSYNDYESYFDGLLEHRNSKFHIFINTGRLKHAHTLRARFTFAHELGHFFIDEHRNALQSGNTPAHSSFTNFASEIYTEREADFFASCLLLPKKRIIKDCYKRKFNFNILDELSKKYQTSLTSTAIRFSEIGNHPILIVFCEDNKIKWHWSSEGFPFKYFLNGINIIPKDTIVAEYFKTNRKPKGTEIVWAMDWFNYVSKRDDSRQFFEHCIPHKNQAISFIWED